MPLPLEFPACRLPLFLGPRGRAHCCVKKGASVISIMSDKQVRVVKIKNRRREALSSSSRDASQASKHPKNGGYTSCGSFHVASESSERSEQLGLKLATERLQSSQACQRATVGPLSSQPSVRDRIRSDPAVVSLKA
ncbi:uncharacterized [Tachysurus ichikawai]